MTTCNNPTHDARWPSRNLDRVERCSIPRDRLHASRSRLFCRRFPHRRRPLLGLSSLRRTVEEAQSPSIPPVLLQLHAATTGPAATFARIDDGAAAHKCISPHPATHWLLVGRGHAPDLRHDREWGLRTSPPSSLLHLLVSRSAPICR